MRVLSDTERQLLEIFAQLLGASPLKIQLEDDFFELGGHSLLATQAIFHISQKLHVRLPVNLLFQSPTIAALSKYATLFLLSTGVSPSTYASGVRAGTSTESSRLAAIAQRPRWSRTS